MNKVPYHHIGFAGFGYIGLAESLMQPLRIALLEQGLDALRVQLQHDCQSLVGLENRRTAIALDEIINQWCLAHAASSALMCSCSHALTASSQA
ncbi:hypothetical protein D3C75_964630 [compost metagenome]